MVFIVEYEVIIIFSFLLFLPNLYNNIDENDQQQQTKSRVASSGSNKTEARRSSKSLSEMCVSFVK